MISILKLSPVIVAITVMILSVITGFIKFFTSKKKRALLEGIKKLASQIDNLKNEKVKKQLQIIKERSDIIYSQFILAYTDSMGIAGSSIKAKLYDHVILRPTREMTDRELKSACHVNNFERKDDRLVLDCGLTQWGKYKRDKQDFVLQSAISTTTEHWNNELIGFTHEEVIDKCRGKIKSIYANNIELLFDDIRCCAIEYNSEIRTTKTLLQETERQFLSIFPKTEKSVK